MIAGACVRACPTNLMANILGRVCEYNMFAEAEKKPYLSLHRMRALRICLSGKTADGAVY